MVEGKLGKLAPVLPELAAEMRPAPGLADVGPSRLAARKALYAEALLGLGDAGQKRDEREE
jgi:hypothetical protein